MDLLDWNSLIDSRTQLSRHLVVPNVQVPPHSNSIVCPPRELIVTEATFRKKDKFSVHIAQ